MGSWWLPKLSQKQCPSSYPTASWHSADQTAAVMIPGAALTPTNSLPGTKQLPLTPRMLSGLLRLLELTLGPPREQRMSAPPMHTWQPSAVTWCLVLLPGANGEVLGHAATGLLETTLHGNNTTAADHMTSNGDKGRAGFSYFGKGCPSCQGG